jgi:hypothetical protein
MFDRQRTPYPVINLGLTQYENTCDSHVSPVIIDSVSSLLRYLLNPHVTETFVLAVGNSELEYSTANGESHTAEVMGNFAIATF